MSLATISLKTLYIKVKQYYRIDLAVNLLLEQNGFSIISKILNSESMERNYVYPLIIIVEKLVSKGNTENKKKR